MIAGLLKFLTPLRYSLSFSDETVAKKGVFLRELLVCHEFHEFPRMNLRRLNCYEI